MHNATAITTGSANQRPNTPCITVQEITENCNITGKCNITSKITEYCNIRKEGVKRYTQGITVLLHVFYKT